MLLPTLTLACACTGLQNNRLGTLAVKLRFDAGWIGSKALFQAKSGGAKSIIPSEDWSPARFAISGTGPGGSVVSLESDDMNIETKLVPGDWEIAVKAFSAANKEVAAGTLTCLLQPGRTTAANIVLYPLEGTGNLSITIASNIEIPAGGRITGNLAYKGLPGHPAPSEPTTLAIDIPSEQTSVSFEALQSGHYSISLRLLASDGVVSGGCADTVMVMSGFLSEGTCLIEMGMPVADLTATLYPSSPLTPPLLSAEHTFSRTHGYMPLGVPLHVPEAGDVIARKWYVNGEVAGEAVRLTGNRGILPEGTYAFPQGIPLSPLSLVRADIVEESRSTFRAGSASVTLGAGEAVDCGSFGWRSSYDYAAALSPSLHQNTAANNGGSGSLYAAKAIAASPSGLVAVSGMDGEGALHAFAAGYGAELDPAVAGAGKTLSIDASWVRLWREKIKVANVVKTADRLAVSNDGRFIASASSQSNWIHLCSLDSNGAFLAAFTATAEGDLKALCFSPDGGRLYAAANSTKKIYAFNINETGISPAWITQLTSGGETLSLQDMTITSSGSIIVTAKDASRIYVLSNEGSLNAEMTIQGASGGTDPYHPGALAISSRGDSFYVLCDEEKIIHFSRADSLSPYAPATSFILPAEAEGSCFIAAGTRSGETAEIVAAAGGANIEFFEIGGDGTLLDGYPLLSAPGVPAGTQMSDMLCFARGAFLLTGGTSGVVSVFGAD